MDKKFLIIIGVLFLVLYLFDPVPYCIPYQVQDVGENITIKSTADISEISLYKIILLHVRGESMLPTINDDSQCLCIKSEEYYEGDVIAFVNGNNDSISHRIISTTGDYVFTKGDGNDFIDFPIPKKNIICKIPEVPRYKTIFIQDLDLSSFI